MIRRFEFRHSNFAPEGFEVLFFKFEPLRLLIESRTFSTFDGVTATGTIAYTIKVVFTFLDFKEIR